MQSLSQKELRLKAKKETSLATKVCQKINY